MLTQLYIEALLVDEELADLVWEAWDVGEIDDELAAIAWWSILFDERRDSRDYEFGRGEMKCVH